MSGWTEAILKYSLKLVTAGCSICPLASISVTVGTQININQNLSSW